MSSRDDPMGPPPLAELAQRTLVVPLTGEPAQPFATLVLRDGRVVLPVFTSREALEHAARRHALRDRLGELRPGEAPGRLTLGHVARAGLDGAVVDLEAPGSYVASRAEVDAAVAGATPPRRAPASASFARATRRPGTESFRVLVVDDDETILEMARRFLVACGAEVETSSSPFGVTGLVSRFRPSVLVLDVSMPALDGEQVASLVRATRERPGLVFWSALDPSSLAALGERIPEAERVPKTAGLDALWDAIQRAHRPAPAR